MALKIEEVKRHLLLFSIILHFLICGRNCHELHKINCCFYCSRIRPRIFDSPSYFFDIIVEQPDFTRDFCKLVQKTSIIDLYIHEDRPVVIESPNFIKRQCDFFQLYEYPQDLMNGLTSVLICLYINLISEDITNLNISISEVCGIINTIYNQVALLMYTFWNQNVVFFL